MSTEKSPNDDSTTEFWNSLLDSDGVIETSDEPMENVTLDDFR